VFSQTGDAVEGFSPLVGHPEGCFLLWKCSGVFGCEFTLSVREHINKAIFSLPGQAF